MTPNSSDPRRLRERISVRYLATFLANVGKMALTLLTGILIARGLGVQGYGDLNFLIGTAIAMCSFLDFGMSSAFYTFLSQHKQGRSFFIFYGSVLVCQFVVVFMFIGYLIPEGWATRLWVGHPRSLVLLAFIATFMNSQLWTAANQLGEACRRTLYTQSALIVISIVNLALIAYFYYFSTLTISKVFWIQALEYMGTSCFLIFFLLPRNFTPSASSDLSSIYEKFIVFCRPLAIFTAVGFLYSFSERWLLQRLGGSIQQGFFSIGQQFGSITLLATTSMIMIYWKEISEAKALADEQKLKSLYTKTLRILYFISSWFSCLVAPHTRWLLIKTLGPSYEGAWLSLLVMLFFPVHSCIGRISNTFCLANGDNATYVRISSYMMAASILLTYIVLASPSARWPGLGAGSLGFCIKMVLLQIMWVNLMDYTIRKRYGWAKEYRYQIQTPLILVGISLLIKIMVISVFKIPVGWGSIGLSFTFYTLITGGLVWYQPLLIGLQHDELMTVVDRLKTSYQTRWLPILHWNA